MKILASIANLFWDAHKTSLDVDKNRHEIITRTINYGTLREWRWLEQQYGCSFILDYINSSSRNGIRPEAKRLAELLFS